MPTITEGLDLSWIVEKFRRYEVMTDESTLKDEVLIYKNVCLVCIHCYLIKQIYK